MSGVHLIIDAEASRGLDDRNRVESFCEQALLMAGMRVLGKIVLQLPTPDYDLGPGIEANYCIAESHLTVHTWPETGRLSFDFYSCRPFDVHEARELFSSHFSVTKFLTYHELERAEMSLPVST